MIKNSKICVVLTVMELVMAFLFVYMDIFIPSILIVVAGSAFLLLRKESFADLGFSKKLSFKKILIITPILALFWQLVDFSLIIPVCNHLTNSVTDYSSFGILKGNVRLLLIYTVASWTIAALGEEFAFRGFVMNRVLSIFKYKKIGALVAILVPSVLFGFIHTEQGIVGVITTSIDAIFFSAIKYKYNNIWVSVFIHGFMNMIGFLVFFFTGSLYGLW